MSTVPAARPRTGLSAPALAIALNAGLAFAAAALWFGMVARGEFWKGDFGAFYTGWSIVLDGRADRLFDLDTQADYQARLIPGRAVPGGYLPYFFPPHFSTFAPLALLPLPAAFAVWTALQAGLLVVVLRWLREDARAWGPAAPAVAVAAFLAFEPLALTFQLGQQLLICLVALYGLARALPRGRTLPAAACLALATLKPQYALLPAAFLLGAGRWRVLFWAAGLFAAWTATVALLTGWHRWVEFLEVTAFHARQYDAFAVYPLRWLNLKMCLVALLGPERLPLVNALTAAAVLLATAAVLVLGLAARRAGRARWELCFAVTSLLALVVSPHLYPHDALLLVVPAVLFYDALYRTGRPMRALAGFLVACPLLILADSFGMAWWPCRVRPFFFVLVGLTAWAARELARGVRAPSGLRPDHQDGVA